MAKRPSEDTRRGIELTWAKFQVVCERLSETGAKYKSCEDCGFNYNTVRGVVEDANRRGDDEWQTLWDNSYEQFRDNLEAEAIRRAKDGVVEKVFGKDGEIGEKVVYSDTLMQTLLRGHLPERYGQQAAQIGAFGIETPDIFAKLSFEAKKQIRDIMVADLAAQAEAKDAKAIEGEFTEVDQIEDRSDEG